MNPFRYQQPLQPDQVIDREEEVGRLLELCDDGMLVRVDGPRRYGKTSLVGKVFAEAEKTGTVGVLVDLKGVLTLTDVITRIGYGYSALHAPAVRRVVQPILTNVEATFGVSFAGTGGSLRLAARAPNEDGALLTLLDVPRRFAERGWRQVIVCFDEFQDVLAVEAADDKMRAAIQHHPDTCAYIFAGSEPRLMNALFADKRRAFWSQAEPIELGPLEPQIVTEHLLARFEESRRVAADVVGSIVGTGAGHPQRTMLLASKVWRRVAEGATATLEDWQASLAAAEAQERPALDAEWRSLGPAEQRVLRAVALGDGRPHRKAVAEAVGLPRGSVGAAAESLVGGYVLRRVGQGRFQFVDPLFELYVGDLASATTRFGESAGEE